MAEGLARKRFAEAGIEVEIDSAGLGDWHIGASPDRRASNAAWKALVDLSDIRARQFEITDFDRFDYILGMDEENIAGLHELMSSHGLGPDMDGKVARLLDYAELEDRNVADPYYGGHDGFDRVAERLELGIAALIAHFKDQS